MGKLTHNKIKYSSVSVIVCAETIFRVLEVLGAV